MSQLMMLLGGAAETLPGLLPPGVAGSNNGQSMAISEDDTTVPRSIVIGAPGVGSGVVHVYQRSISGVFSFFTTLVPSPPIPNMEFGASVAISDDATKIIVGAPGDVLTQDAGVVVAYIWNGTGYDLEDTLTPSAAAPGDGARFGSRVSMDKQGLSFIVSAPNGFAGQGAMYSFFYSVGWQPTVGAIFEIPGRSAAQFGSFIDLSSDGLLMVATSPTPASGNPKVFWYNRALVTDNFVAESDDVNIASGVNSIVLDPAGLITFVAGASIMTTFVPSGGGNWQLQDSVTPDSTGGNWGIGMAANGTHVIVGQTAGTTSGTISIYAFDVAGDLTFIRTEISPANQTFAAFGTAIAAVNTPPQIAVGEPLLDRTVQFADEGNAYALVT